MEQIQQNNRRAFKKLFDHYSDYAHRLAFTMIKNRHDASDVVQETFIKVYRYSHTYDLNQPFQPWFYRILVNEAKRLFQARSKDSLQMESEKIEFFHQNEDGPAADELDIALAQLQEKERIIPVLKYAENFTEKEIASMLDLKVNTVKSRLYRARQKLRSIIERIDRYE